MFHTAQVGFGSRLLLITSMVLTAIHASAITAKMLMTVSILSALFFLLAFIVCPSFSLCCLYYTTLLVVCQYFFLNFFNTYEVMKVFGIVIPLLTEALNKSAIAFLIDCDVKVVHCSNEGADCGECHDDDCDDDVLHSDYLSYLSLLSLLYHT